MSGVLGQFARRLAPAAKPAVAVRRAHGVVPNTGDKAVGQYLFGEVVSHEPLIMFIFARHF